MKHHKFKTNKLTTVASQYQSQKPQQEYVFFNLPVLGIQRETGMKHAKFKTNKLTTAARWTKAENNKTSKKGFLRGGSDGVDHVARDVLQHGVANRGSQPPSTRIVVANTRPAFSATKRTNHAPNSSDQQAQVSHTSYRNKEI